MTKQISGARAALMGLLFAMMGFTYALASSRSLDSTADAAQSRIVGSQTLRFLNPVVSGERDLGDVTLGSFVMRIVRAAGGIRPYTYTSTVSPTLKEVLTGTTSTLNLMANGVLGGAGTNPGGTIVGLTAAAFPLRFHVDVSDSRGTNPFTARDLFRLSLENSTTFKFAIDDMGEAVQFQPFFATIPTVNGNGAITYSLVANSVTIDGAGRADLETLGISLSTDGTLQGIPLEAGVLKFTIAAKDAAGAFALNRDKTAANQTITLNITGNSLIQTEFVVSNFSLKVANATGAARLGNRDSLKLKGLVNLGSHTISDLNGEPIQLVVGGYTSPNSTATPATLQNGRTARGSRDGPRLNARVTARGQVSISITNENLSRVSAFQGSSRKIGVGIMIGDALVSSQVLVLDAKASRGGVRAKYRFGSTNTPGGTFLLTSVRGKDDTRSAAEDDAWQAQFIATPQNGVKFNNVDHATVSIGTAFTDVIGVGVNRGKVKQNERRDRNAAKVIQLQMDESRGKGRLRTGPLPRTQTGIPEAGQPTGNARVTFPLNITLTQGSVPTYAGEGSQDLVSKRTTWSNRTR